MTDFSTHLLDSVKLSLTSNQQENHFSDKKPWGGGWGRVGDEVGKTGERISVVGNTHLCKELVL